MISDIKKVKDDFQAFLVSGATFVGNEEYPLLESWMISPIMPEKIITFSKAIESRRKNLKDYFICFYTRDKNFLRVLHNPRRYTKFFARCGGIIGFDLSPYNDMPLAVQKIQMYKSLALTYFFATQGVPVIPNIRWGREETRDDFLTAIPKHSLIAIGTHGFIKTYKEQEAWRQTLYAVIAQLEPSGIVVYGTLPKHIENLLILNNIPCYKYPSERSVAFHRYQKEKNSSQCKNYLRDS